MIAWIKQLWKYLAGQPLGVERPTIIFTEQGKMKVHFEEEDTDERRNIH